MKKTVLLPLFLTVVFINGCGGNTTPATEAATTVAIETTTEAETLSEKDLHSELSKVYDKICSTYESCDTMASNVIYAWGGHKEFVSWIFDTKEYKRVKDNYGVEADLAKVIEESQKIITRMPSELIVLKDELKEYNDYSDDSYYKALKDLYLSVQSYSEFAVAVPSNYSQVTYTEAINEHRDEFTDLKNKAEFEK